MRCQQELLAEGKPYPRTCGLCGLGPCQRKPVDKEADACECSKCGEEARRSQTLANHRRVADNRRNYLARNPR